MGDSSDPMVKVLSPAALRAHRLRAQRLDPRPDEVAGTAGVARVVRHLGGVQAQYPSAASLAIRIRGTGFTAQDVERARVRERSIVRTWCMRGTLHLIAAEDLGWLLPLLGPVFMQRNRRRRAELGLDDKTTDRGMRALRHVLTDEGPLTRAEIVARLGDRRVQLVGQAAPHLLANAAFAGLLGLGPDRDGEPTYVELDGWVARGPALPREAALAELARRYLDAYGPASPGDLAAWSGLPIGEVRAGWQRIAGQLIEIETTGGPAWMTASHAGWPREPSPPGPTVRLLPAFDAYLLGYQSWDFAVATRHARRIHPGGGVLRPTLLVDGHAAGTWSVERARDGIAVVAAPFASLTADAGPALAAEAADIGRFLGTDATLTTAAPSDPT